MTRFSHIAGDSALDLVNTVEWRLSDEDREEDLTSYADVVDWCLESTLVTPEEAALLRGPSRDDAAQEYARVIDLREALYRALFAQDPDATQAITTQLHQALVAADYAPNESSWSWHDRELTIATPRHRIARAMMAFLSRPDLNRLHQCEDIHCGWVFIDTSRAHNRRWCVTKDCGDRNRSRAYYARQKQQT